MASISIVAIFSLLLLHIYKLTIQSNMNNFVAIDFETANADRSSICQIGITEVVDGILQPSKSWLVQPEGNDYDPFNIDIHGIKPEDTENSPEFPDVWKEVYPYLRIR